MTHTYSIDQLRNVGGRLWEKNGMRRVYFDAAALYGLEVARYHTGNISTAYLDGELISNSAASRLLSQVGAAKFWYDLTDNCWRWRIPEGRVSTEAIAQTVTDRLTAQLTAEAASEAAS